MVLWERWLRLKVDQLLLYIPYARARFSKLFFFKSFLSLSRRKSVTWIISVGCVNTFAQELRGQITLRAGAWYCHSLARIYMGLGKLLLISKLTRRSDMISDGNTELEESLFISNFSWEHISSQRKFPVSCKFSSNTVKRESLPHIKNFCSYQSSRKKFPEILQSRRRLWSYIKDI